MMTTRRHTLLMIAKGGGWLLGLASLFVAVRITLAQPPIPHPLEGRSDCLACHQEGLGGAPQIPENHEGRTNQMCTACHVPSAEGPVQPPAIPHTLVGRSDCLFCHQTGVSGATLIPADHAGRTNETCQSCHQPGAAPETPPTPSGPPAPTPLPIPTSIIHPTAAEQNTCATCHATLGDAQAQIVREWETSIHAARAVSCADCHGGDPGAAEVNQSMAPAAGYVGVPERVAIPGLCASCHSDPVRMRQYNLPTDQFAKYQESVHGRALYEHGDTRVAICIDCHGIHDTPEVNDPSADVYPINVPGMCARCHTDEQLMAPYGIATNQYDLYQYSVHGIALLQHQDLRAPSCATCHGTHGAAPPGFAEVANVCGSCHSATQDYYLQSVHARAGEAGPECVTCHGRYDVLKPDETLFTGAEERHCGSCHAPDSAAGKQVAEIREALVEAAATLAEAEGRVAEVDRRGMIVAREEGKLSEAWTELVTARAAQHQVDPAVVAAHTQASLSASEPVIAAAEEKLRQSQFRRQAMVVAVVAIAVTIGALYSIKRDLDRRLE